MSPLSTKRYSALEKVQHTAARYAMNTGKAMLNSLDWSTLGSRRLYLFQASYVLQNNQQLHRSSVNIPISNSNIHQRTFTTL